MSRVLKALVPLAVLALAGYLAHKVLRKEDGGRGAEPPPAPEAPGLPEGAAQRLAEAPDLLAPDVYRELYAGHPAPRARGDLARLLETRARAAGMTLAREVEKLLLTFRYRSAVELAERYGAAWQGTAVADAAGSLVEELREEQAAQVRARDEESRELLELGRFDAARESLATQWELEQRYAVMLDELKESLERRIRVRQFEPLPRPPPERPEAGRAPTLRTEPSLPPALPGYPHPDVKRLAEARELLALARRLHATGKHQPAAKALGDVVGFYGDLRFVQRRREGLGALEALARHGAQGLSGLFHATHVKRDGRRVKLTYEFATDAEALDWEGMQLFPNQKGGEFGAARNGVRGTGIAAYLLRASFENDVTIRCTARIQWARSHGLVLCQDELETRFLMWMLSNHYFVEGENYVKARPGHALLMWGKGVNADVPVDSPDLGFIFRGDSLQKPELRDGSESTISFTLRDNTMSGEIDTKGGDGKRTGSTLGDDGRGIERTRPGLFVIDNSVVFSQIVVEGRLHAGFEKKRLNDLLNLVTLLDEG